MIEKIDHIGIAVKNLEDALSNYKNLYGIDPIKIETMEKNHIRMAFLKIGEVLIELLEPTEPGAGRIGEFITDNGEGFEHIALRVDDIDKELAQLKARNIALRDNIPRQGADNARIAYIEPVHTQNVLTELVERKNEVI